MLRAWHSVCQGSSLHSGVFLAHFTDEETEPREVQHLLEGHTAHTAELVQ